MKMQNVPRKRILVVDDEPLVNDAIRLMLAVDGHEVVTAGDAKEALALFEPGKFDLVLTDYAMPEMKGDELAVAIKARAPGQPVVMITAYAEMLKESNTPLDAVDGVVSKPFRFDDLRAAVRKATGG